MYDNESHAIKAEVVRSGATERTVLYFKSERSTIIDIRCFVDVVFFFIYPTYFIFRSPTLVFQNYLRTYLENLDFALYSILTP